MDTDSAVSHLAGALQAGEPGLTQRLVHADGHSIGKIQAPRIGDHGKSDAPVTVRFPEVQGQTGGLLAEEQPAVRGETGLLIGAGGLGGGEPQIVQRLRVTDEQFVQIFIVGNVVLEGGC